MANVKITELPAATSITPGQDVLPLVSGGVTTKATPNQIVDAALADGVSGSTPAGVALVRIEQTGDGYALLVEDSTTPDATPFCVQPSGGVSIGNTLDAGAGNLYVANNIAATQITATTNFLGPSFKAVNSAGGTLKASNDAACIQWGGGGAPNVTIDAGLTALDAVTLSPASKNVTISPTGTGVVAINPATAGTINNMAIGGTTPAAGNFTALSTTNSSIMQKSTLFKNVTGGEVVSIAGAGGATEPVLKFSANDAGQLISMNINSVDGTTGAALSISGILGQPKWTIDSYGNIFPSQGTTTQTNGLFYIPSCSGAPTGTPAVENAGITCLMYDETNNYLYAYNGGWKRIGPFA